jgi:hypothetical protein
MKAMKTSFIKAKNIFRRIYRIVTISKSSKHVWKELIKYHKTSGWRFGQYDNDSHVECSFRVDETNSVDFTYSVHSDNLQFRSIILQRFDEELTNDILVLASHFNGLLHFGVVKVSVKYNFVEFVYSRDLLTYSLFSGEISSDTDTHFRLAKDCFWTFTNLIETGDDPVFIFSELLRRKEEENNKNSIAE